MADFDTDAGPWLDAANARALPSSIESEKALLGGLLLRPDLLDIVREQVRADDFYAPHHAKLFELFVQMRERGEPIDVITVIDRVRAADSAGRERRFGDLAYVASLPDSTPATTNLGHYAKTVADKAVLRRLIGIVDQARDQAVQHAEGRPLAEQTSAQLNDLVKGALGSKWHELSIEIDEAVDRLEALSKRADKGLRGLTTGFKKLDDMLAGLQKGDLVILGARPSMGKTAFALNIVEQSAELGRVGVAVFSLEMGREQLVDRMLSGRAAVNASRMRTGALKDEEWTRLLDASDELRKLRIYLEDSAGLRLSELRTRARQIARKDTSLGLIVVDYLQLMQADDPRMPRHQAVSEFSRGLKQLAKELQVPIVALSQLSRAVEERQDKRPMMSDLRESGSIEQDADVIMFIYRDEYYNKQSVDKGLAEIIVAKHRNGATGDFKLVFRGENARFQNLGDDDDDRL